MTISKNCTPPSLPKSPPLKFPPSAFRFSKFSPTRPPRAPFEFPRVSGHLSRRGTSIEIARVRKHPSPPTRRGNRKGHGRVSGDQWAGAGLRGPSSSAKRVRSVVGPLSEFSRTCGIPRTRGEFRIPESPRSLIFLPAKRSRRNPIRKEWHGFNLLDG